MVGAEKKKRRAPCHPPDGRHCRSCRKAPRNAPYGRATLRPATKSCAPMAVVGNDPGFWWPEAATVGGASSPVVA